MKELIIRESGVGAYDYIAQQVNVEDPNTLLVSTSTPFNIEKQFQDEYYNIVNLKRVNDFRHINKLFEAVNSKLCKGGLFIGNVETYWLRKQRILRKFPPVINWMIYTLDYLIRRVSPKVWGLKKVYFFLSRGNNRVLSKAETLGRLYSCGFEVVDERFIGDRFYFTVRKIKEPIFDYNPTYGPLITLKRQGKNGKEIKVYKMRTMHAYSEYLQEYIYKNNQLQAGGKFKDDFRITTVGSIFRKFWLDELPMLLNWLKRDLKIVGVRPLSKHYLSLYPEEYRNRRMKYRPGLVPPFYVDLPKELDEIIESEKRYLDAYDKHPFLTDWKYFWKAFHNIVFKRARSK